MKLQKLLLWLRQSKAAYVLFPKEVQQDMQALGKDSETYYLHKLQTAGGLLLAGIVLGIGYFVWYQLGAASTIEKIDRPKAYEETVRVPVQAGKQKDTYLLEVMPRILSKEEADRQVKEVMDLLGNYILGENEHLDCVTTNLYLPDAVEEYPFIIYWESDKAQIIDETGTVNRYGLTEDEIVMLTAIFYYEDWMWEMQFGVQVQKEQLTEKERYKRQLEELLKEQEQAQRMESSFVLPKAMEGEEVVYTYRSEDTTVLILAGLFAAMSVVLWCGQDNDLRIARKKRRAVFEEEYETFLSSLSMYISAGVTLQSAINMCARDYAKRKPAGHLFREALQEVSKDMQNGYSFSSAIERFSLKTDEMNYRKLAGLLGQNVINGSRGLAVTLEEEVEKVQEEKRRHSKVKGEEISTALIAPMMLQLGIVIALIMIPAFTSMQF